MSAYILVVDDERSICDVLTAVLQREGYNVVTAADGYEAIEKISESSSESFNMAIVDITIPGPNGLDILRYIKNASPDTEVMMVSGHADFDLVIEAMHQQAYDYIVKPLDINIVLDVVRKGLEKQTRTVETRQLLTQLEQKSRELSILYELRDNVSYTLDYRELVSPIMNSLHRIIDHDLSAFLFMAEANAPDAYRGELTVWVKRGTPTDVIGEVKSNLVDAFNTITAPIGSRVQGFKRFLKPETLKLLNLLSEDMVSVHVSETAEISESPRPRGDDSVKLQGKLRSFLNVALVIRDEGENRLAGIINIGSYKPNAFDQSAVGLFYNIASHLSNALERLTKVLAGEKSKLEMMVGSMTDGVIMLDQRGRVAVLNPAARRMLGLEQRSADAENLTRYIGNTRLSRVLDKVWSHRYSNKLLPLEKGAGGILGLGGFEDGFEEEILVEKTRKFLSASVSPIKGVGKTYGVVAVLRDVTRRKEIDEAKSAFVSSVSHELRTPLTVIKNAVSIIEMAGEVTDQQRKFISTTMRNIDRLERLINSILDFSKLEDGKLEMRFDLVDLKALAHESVSALQNLAANKSIKIIENIPDDLPEIYADHHRLDQVFTNIIDNAIKYTPENGQVTITLREVNPLLINGELIPMPKILPNPGFVEVSASDTGIGISPEDHKRIFDRFERAFPSSYRTGVGLGLSIAKMIIESHYGEIWVESEPGKGSKFAFVLPVDKKFNTILNLIRASDREIKLAKANEVPFSLMLTLVEPAESDKILEGITRFIQNNNAHAKNIVMCVGAYGIRPGLVFSLCEGNKHAFADVEKQIPKFLRQQNIANVNVKSWIATYPDDGTSTVELIDSLARNFIGNQL